MPRSDQHLFDCYLKEFEKLKDEQTQRIGYRDNLVYATLIAIGGVFAYSLEKADHFSVMLVLPLDPLFWAGVI